MIFKYEAKEKIEVTSEILSEIDSKFTNEQLSSIKKEVSIIKNEKFLDDQIRVGGNILGDIFRINDYDKVLLLSQYIDLIVAKIQTKLK